MTANQTVDAAASLREFALGPGAIFPDWSVVTSDGARAVVNALIDLAGLEDRWRDADEPDLKGIRLSIDEAFQVGKAVFTPMLAGT